jgi:hypothetical protein
MDDRWAFAPFEIFGKISHTAGDGYTTITTLYVSRRSLNLGMQGACLVPFASWKYINLTNLTASRRTCQHFFLYYQNVILSKVMFTPHIRAELKDGA